MCLLENELESQLGEFHVRMKGKHVPLRPWPAACPPAARWRPSAFSCRTGRLCPALCWWPVW